MFPILWSPFVPFIYKVNFSGVVNSENGAKNIVSTAQNYLLKIFYVCNTVIYLSPMELINKEKGEEEFVLWFSKFIQQTKQIQSGA